MTPADLEAIKEVVTSVVATAESSTRSIILLITSGLAVVGVIISAAVQLNTQRKLRDTQEAITKRQIANQDEISRLQRQTQQVIADIQLDMQDLVSRRVAAGTIAAKRQVWIDELRKDMAEYLSIWQDISYRWDMIASSNNGLGPTKEESEKWIIENESKRLEVHKLRIRIQLRLNAREPQHVSVKELMLKLEHDTEFLDRKNQPFPLGFLGVDVREVTEQILVRTQTILKEEWDRIKIESYVKP